jgi:hypothetical protein
MCLKVYFSVNRFRYILLHSSLYPAQAKLQKLVSGFGFLVAKSSQVFMEHLQIFLNTKLGAAVHIHDNDAKSLTRINDR